ncbi:glycosyltransferase [bacterium 3DAC]|nr:glycosyltransferase [bacterium 3DAC]
MKVLWTLTGPWEGHRWQRMFLDLSTHNEIQHVYVIERSYDILTYPIRGMQRQLPPPIPIKKDINKKLSVIRFPLLYPEKLFSTNLLVKWIKPIISYIKPDIGILVSPFHIPWAIALKLAGAKALYFVYDEILYSEDGKPRQDTVVYENKMAHIVDGIVVTAPVLMDTRKHYGKPIYIRPNGTDTSMWEGPHKEPDFIKNIPHPRIIFHGHMGPWIDHKLFLDIVKALPHYHFIVIGKLSGNATSIANLEINNLHFIPFKPQEEVAAAVYHSDIALMPFKTENRFSKAINPLKLYEALAAGIPTIISNLPSIPQGPGIYVYKNKEDILKHIQDIENNPPNKEAISKFAKQWDWHNINKTMIEIMGGTVNA